MPKTSKAIDKNLDDDEIIISGNTYKLIRKLGEGNRGAVYLAETDDGKQVCIKKETSGIRALKESKAINACYNTSERSLIPNMDKKYQTQKSIDPKDVQKKHESSVEEHNGYYYFPMPYFKGKTLKELQNSLTLYQKTIIAKKLKEKIERIHKTGYIHCDLKPDNMIVDISDNEIHVHIIDMGRSVSKDLPKGIRLLPTPKWKLWMQTQISPETAATGKVSKKSDYYAYGKIFRALFPESKDVVDRLTAFDETVRKHEFKHLDDSLEKIFDQHRQDAIVECDKHLVKLNEILKDARDKAEKHKQDADTGKYKKYESSAKNIEYAVYTLELLKKGLGKVKYKETASLSKHKKHAHKKAAATQAESMNMLAPTTLEQVVSLVGQARAALNVIEYKPTSLWQKLLKFLNIFAPPQKAIRKWLDKEPAQFFKPKPVVAESAKVSAKLK